MAEKIDSEADSNASPEPSFSSVQNKVDPLDVVVARRTVRRHVKDLAGIFAVILFGISIYLLLKHRSMADAGACVAAGLFLLALGYWTPRLMLPLWRAWMALGKVLEVMTTIPIMWVLWFIIVIPTSLAARNRARQPLDMKFRAPVNSYWLPVKDGSNDWKKLERQY